RVGAQTKRSAPEVEAGGGVDHSSGDASRGAQVSRSAYVSTVVHRELCYPDGRTLDQGACRRAQGEKSSYSSLRGSLNPTPLVVLPMTPMLVPTPSTPKPPALEEFP